MPRIERNGDRVIFRKNVGSMLVISVPLALIGTCLALALLFFHGSMQFNHRMPDGTLVAGPATEAELFSVAIFAVAFCSFGYIPTLGYLVARYTLDSAGISSTNLLGQTDWSLLWGDIASLSREKYPRFSFPASLLIHTRQHGVYTIPAGVLFPVLKDEIYRRTGLEKESMGKDRIPGQTKGDFGSISGSFSRTYRIALGIIWLASCLIIVGPALWSTNPTRDGSPVVLVIILIVFAGIGIAIVMHAINVKLIVSDRSLARRDLFGRTTDELLWKDVRGFEKEFGGSTRSYLMWTADEYIRVYSHELASVRLREDILVRMPSTAVVNI